MRRVISRRNPLPIATAIGIVALGLSGIATAAGASTTLKVKGEYAKRQALACHQHHHYRFFHRRSTMEFEGYYTPAPAGHFSASLELKRCVHGHWRRLPDRTAKGKKLTGKYKAFFPARPLAPRSHSRRAVTYYSARASVNGTRSEKVYFAVTN